MKQKKLDAIFSDSITLLLNSLDKEKVQKEDIVQIFQNEDRQYIAIFYQ